MLPSNSYMPERRCGSDRRKWKISIFATHWLSGNRKLARRAEDSQKPYKIDRYGSKALVAILICILLALLDTTLTLFLISRGAVEINPFMAFLIEQGAFVFFAVKYLLTCTCLVFILLYKNSYLFGTKYQAKALFILFAIPYALVVNWELYLIVFVV
jgi:hypothetical protein